MNPAETIRTNSAGLRAAAARDRRLDRACDTTVRMAAVGHAPRAARADESSETVQLDEAAIARLTRQHDVDIVAAARDLEDRIRTCGKTADADLVRSLRERVIAAMGVTP